MLDRVDNNIVGPVLFALMLTCLGATLAYALTGVQALCFLGASIGLYAALASSVTAKYLAKVILTAGIFAVLNGRPDVFGLSGLRKPDTLILALVGFLMATIHFYWPWIQRHLSWKK